MWIEKMHVVYLLFLVVLKIKTNLKWLFVCLPVCLYKKLLCSTPKNPYKISYFITQWWLVKRPAYLSFDWESISNCICCKSAACHSSCCTICDIVWLPKSCHSFLVDFIKHNIRFWGLNIIRIFHLADFPCAKNRTAASRYI